MKLPVQTLAKGMLLMILISTILSFRAIPVSASTAQLSAIPSTSPVTVPNQFYVDINVTGVTDLFSWQIKLYYNPTALLWTNVTLPPGHVFDGKPMSIGGPNNETDSDGTYILFLVSLQGEVARFDGSGILCRIYFGAQAAGTSALNFSRPYDDWTYLLNYDLSTIPAELVDGSVTTQGADTRAPTEISIYVDKSSLVTGDSVNISGAINVTVPNGTPVYIEYWTGITWHSLATTDTTNSSYEYIWMPSEGGTQKIRAKWGGDAVYYKPATSEERIITVIVPEAWLKIQPNNMELFKSSPTPLPTAPFNLNVTIENVTDLYRWKFNLNFDPAILEAINATVPTNNVFGADHEFDYLIDNVQGSIQVSANSTATAGGFNGTGILCQVEFRSIRYAVLKNNQPYAQTFLRFDKTATDLKNSTEAVIYVNYVEDYDCRLEIYSSWKRISYITLQAATQVLVGSIVNFTGQITPTGVGEHINVTLRYSTSAGGAQQALAVSETDNESRFTFSWNADTLGTYYFNASWAGDEVNDGASATKIVHVVEEITPEAGTDYTLYIVIGVVVVAVVVAIVVYLKKFRHS
jgi:hypothetical protein